MAIKIVDKGKLDEKTRRMLNQEIAAMERVHHPNIIRLYEVLETYSKVLTYPITILCLKHIHVNMSHML